MEVQHFAGKTVIVTGGASGIGKASAARFAARGANVVIADVNADGADGVARTLADEHGVKTLALGFDAGDPAACRAMIDRAVEAFGRIDVLCNIAGIMDWGPLDQFTDERWERMLRINLSSLFHLSRHAMPHLVQSKGNIVNMSSAAGLVGIAYTTAYCASKAGVIAMTKSLAVEFAAAGVRVNAICPSGVKTPMHAQNAFPEGIDIDLLMRNAPKMYGGELSEADDIAASVVYLASSEARYVSGVALAIDGAQTAG
jgi:NAD(P)-dependent dehydrogenase (short-subunit alcohol dehydrogenase family)